jgi:tetratricopeptide (TPR) repeat protein
MKSFQRAVRLNSTHVSLYYNYGLLLQQQNKVKEAEQLFLKGYALDPQALNINFALTFYYMNQRLPQKARKHAEVLRRLDPGNPEYQPVFCSLGL